jgi:hypothetical protein
MKRINFGICLKEVEQVYPSDDSPPFALLMEPIDNSDDHLMLRSCIHQVRSRSLSLLLASGAPLVVLAHHAVQRAPAFQS